MLTELWKGPQTELEAVQVAIGGDPFARLRQALRAGYALARNTNDTQQVFYLAYAVDRETLPRIAARVAADPNGRALIRERAAIDSHSVDYAALRALPANTLGGAYVRSLDANGLDPDIFKRPPGMPEDLAYVAQRSRQTHDILHVLTGLGTDIPGEVALQAFTHAQLGLNFSKLIVKFGLALFGFRYPRMWGMVKRARRAGAQAAFLLPVRWEDLWAEPLENVRARFGIEPASA